LSDVKNLGSIMVIWAELMFAVHNLGLYCTIGNGFGIFVCVYGDQIQY